MGLKLKELQRVINNVVKEEKNFKFLCEEIVKVFGPTILTSKGLNCMARDVNNRLDIFEITGVTPENINTSLLLNFAKSDFFEVRKLVVRLIPENFLKLFIKDSHPTVRFAVAKRLPYRLVKEMIGHHPFDKGLKTIERAKRITEAGLPTPDVSDKEFDLYGDESIKTMIGTIDFSDLTDTWYETTALKIINSHGVNIDKQWEELAVKRYVASMASMGVEVNYEKLLDVVYDLLTSREDKVLDEGLLKSIVLRLRMDEAVVMPIIPESIDLVETLTLKKLSSSEYIQKFEEIFSVKYVTTLSPAYHILCEGSKKITYPARTTLLQNSIRNIDERALDLYVTSWNSRNSIQTNAPYKLTWLPSSTVKNFINFHLELKK